MNKLSDTAQAKENARKARYIAEKTDLIKANLPRGYGEKVNNIADELNISKAQVLKIAIDTLYNQYF